MNRYAKNNLSKEVQTKLLNSKVLVCGCGGLGSGVIANLAGLGIGTLGLCDFDRVEITNLNRQFVHRYENIGKYKSESAKEWINAYNPEIEVITYSEPVSEKMFPDYDLVVDCTDNFKTKFQLNDFALNTDKPFIHAGVSGINGQIMSIIPHKTACLRCVLDETQDEPENSGVISPAVSAIASIESLEVFKLLTGEGEPLLNKVLFVNFKEGSFRTINFSKNPHCIC